MKKLFLIILLFICGKSFAQDLTGQPRNTTYGGVIHLSGNGGATGTLQTVYDGLGNALPIQLSTTSIKIPTGFTLGSTVTNVTAAQLNFLAGLTDTVQEQLNAKVALTSFSSTATGLTYTNTTGVFSWTANYFLPTDSMATVWNAKKDSAWVVTQLANYLLTSNFNTSFSTQLATKNLDSIATGTVNVHLTSSLKSTYDGYATTLNGKANIVDVDSLARLSLSSSATGLTYTNTTGVFSWTSGYTGLTDSMRTLWSGKIGLTSLSAISPLNYNNGTGAFSVASGFTIPTDSAIAVFNAKQAALVSGTNIKSINGNSVLGSGDLTVTASSDSANASKFLGTNADSTGLTDGKIWVYRSASNKYVLEAKPTSSGEPAWGDITGTLSSQTDLNNALGARWDTTTTKETISDSIANKANTIQLNSKVDYTDSITVFATPKQLSDSLISRFSNYWTSTQTGAAIDDSLGSYFDSTQVKTAIDDSLDNYSPLAGSSSLTITGALNSGSITSGFGNIDIGTDTAKVGHLKIGNGSTIDSAKVSNDSLNVWIGADKYKMQKSYSASSATPDSMKMRVSNFTTTSTGLVDITGLSIAVAANKKYLLHIEGICKISNAAGSLDISFSSPTGTYMSGCSINETMGVMNINNYLKRVTSFGSNIPFHGGGSIDDMIFIGDYLIETSSTAGNITLQTKSSDGGYTVTIYAGTFIRVEETN